MRAIEVKHWGARLRRDTWRGYTGFVVEREGRRLLIAGDTAGDDPLSRAIGVIGPYDAAVMPIGAYNPWIRNHCTPEQAVAMADAANARFFVAGAPSNVPLEQRAVQRADRARGSGAPG